MLITQFVGSTGESFIIIRTRASRRNGRRQNPVGDQENEQWTHDRHVLLRQAQSEQSLRPRRNRIFDTIRSWFWLPVYYCIFLPTPVWIVTVLFQIGWDMYNSYMWSYTCIVFSIFLIRSNPTSFASKVRNDVPSSSFRYNRFFL